MAPMWCSNFIHSLINRRFLICGFFCVSSSSSDKRRQGLYSKASVNVKLHQLSVCLDWRMVPVELTQNLAHLHAGMQNLAQRHRLRAVNAPVPGSPSCWALWFAAPDQFVPEDSAFQWRRQEEKMFGRSESWWDDGDSLGAARFLSTYLHGSWCLISKFCWWFVCWLSLLSYSLL